MTYETKQAYSEVCAVLENMPNEYVSKIPERIINLFKTEKLENFQPNINKSNPLDKNYLSKKAMVLIAMLNYQYWCPNKKVKEDLYNQYLENNKIYKKEIDTRYSVDNLFKSRKEIIESKNTVDTVKEKELSLIKYEEDKWYKKIFSAIKKLFNKNY